MKAQKTFIRKFILTCNPWFLASTVLILTGIYSLYTDPAYEKDESGRVLFSFISLELYQFAALGAVFFFRRLNQLYDSVMLTVITSLLFMVPFINLSYAAEVNENFSFTLGLGLTVCGLCLLQMLLLKKFYKNINFPPMLIACGFILIMVNFLTPMVMNGLNDDQQQSLEFMTAVWHYGVPLIVLAVWLVLSGVKDGKKLYERKWLPVTVLGCWTAVSLINFISINYVYSVDFKLEYAALIGYSAFHIIRLMYPSKGSETDICLLWIIVLFPLVLRNYLPVHFTFMIIINAALFIKEKNWSHLAACIILLGVNLCSMTVWECPGELHFGLVCLFLYSLIFTFKNQNFTDPLLSAIIYLILVFIFTGDITMFAYFQSLSIIMLSMVFWREEKILGGKLTINLFACLWCGVGIAAQLHEGEWLVSSIAAAVLAICCVRMFFVWTSLPKMVMLCSFLIIASDIFMIILESLSRSLLITLLGFTVFFIGVYFSWRRSREKLQRSETK